MKKVLLCALTAASCYAPYSRSDDDYMPFFRRSFGVWAMDPFMYDEEETNTPEIQELRKQLEKVNEEAEESHRKMMELRKKIHQASLKAYEEAQVAAREKELHYHVDEKEAETVIIFSNVVTEKTEAATTKDQLRVATDTGTIAVQSKGNYLLITIEKEKKKKRKDGKGGKQYSRSYGSATMGKHLEKAVDITKARVSYSKSHKQLTVTIPQVKPQSVAVKLDA